MKLTSNRLLSIMQGLPAAHRYHLAFSGGLDSTALLHCLAGVRDRLPGELQALHVHHGLQADADAWGAHCKALCYDLSIPYQQIELTLISTQGQSLEAMARDARYAALADVIQEGEMLLTAQHQDDQAETLLLQLMRGSGPAGLAAMPRLLGFGPGWLARPLLDVPRAAVEEYARQYRLSWVEDPSNRDQRFDRNFIRQRVMPLLRDRWPAASATIARSARLSGELQGLVNDQATEDLQSVRGPWPGTLSVSGLLSLSPARRRSLLRHWVRELGGALPGSRHLRRIEDECLLARRDATPLVHWGDCEVRRFRDGLFLLMPQPPHDPCQVIPWSGVESLSLPSDLGRLVLEATAAGISWQQWLHARVEVRFRQGGERCLVAGSKRHRRLKTLFQEWQVPPWDRERIPLLFIDGELAAIPGYLCCEPFRALPGEVAVMPRWVKSEE